MEAEVVTLSGSRLQGRPFCSFSGQMNGSCHVSGTCLSAVEGPHKQGYWKRAPPLQHPAISQNFNFLFNSATEQTCTSASHKSSAMSLVMQGAPGHSLTGSNHHLEPG